MRLPLNLALATLILAVGTFGWVSARGFPDPDEERELGLAMELLERELEALRTEAYRPGNPGILERGSVWIPVQDKLSEATGGLELLSEADAAAALGQPALDLDNDGWANEHERPHEGFLFVVVRLSLHWSSEAGGRSLTSRGILYPAPRTVR